MLEVVLVMSNPLPISATWCFQITASFCLYVVRGTNPQVCYEPYRLSWATLLFFRMLCHSRSGYSVVLPLRSGPSTRCAVLDMVHRIGVVPLPRSSCCLGKGFRPNLYCLLPRRSTTPSRLLSTTSDSSSLILRSPSTHRQPHSPALAQLGRVLDECLADNLSAFEMRAGIMRARIHWQEACLEDFQRQLRQYAPTLVEQRREREKEQRDAEEKQQWPTLSFTEANRAELQGKVAAMHKEHKGAALQLQAAQELAREERLALPSSSGRTEPQLQLPDVLSVDKPI